MIEAPTPDATTGAEHRQRRSRLRIDLCFAAEALLAIVLAMIQLDAKSFSEDEGATAIFTGDGWGGLFDVFRHVDANMSLYEASEKLWRVFGDSEFVLRLPSVFAVGLSVFVVAKLAERLFGTRTGLVAGLLFATSRMLIEEGQNARGYALVVLLTAVATYAFVVAIEQGGAWPCVVFAGTTALGIYSHFFAFFVVAAQVVSLGFIDRSLRSLRPLFVALTAAGVLCLPLALLVSGTGTNQIDWIRAPDLHLVVRTLGALGTGSARSLALGAFIVISVVALVSMVRKAGRGLEAWRLGLVVSWLVIPAAITLVLALTVKPIWYREYLVIALAPLAIVSAYGITRITDIRLVAGATAVIVILGIPTTLDWYRADTDDFRAATAAVLDRTQRGDGIVFCHDFARRPFEYYAGRDGRPRPDPIWPPERWGDGMLLDERVASRALRADVAAHPRIWLVTWGIAEEPVPAVCRDRSLQTLFHRDYHSVDVRLVRSPR